MGHLSLYLVCRSIFIYMWEKRGLVCLRARARKVRRGHLVSQEGRIRVIMIISGGEGKKREEEGGEFLIREV